MMNEQAVSFACAQASCKKFTRGEISETNPIISGLPFTYTICKFDRGPGPGQPYVTSGLGVCSDSLCTTVAPRTQCTTDNVCCKK